MYYFELNIRDFIADTTGLSQNEYGAYFLLLMEYYRKGEPLPDDIIKLCKTAKATTQKERQALVSVLDQYFPVGEDGLRHNNRADEEIEKYINKQQANAKNGKLGGRPKKPNDNPKESERFSNGNPNETQAKGNQEPVTKNQEPVTKNHRVQAFAKPSLEVVSEFFGERGYPAAEAPKFWHYYEANGWRVGKNPMKNWKSAAAGWVVRANDFKPKANGKHESGVSLDEHRANFEAVEAQFRSGRS
jgi:uncharacterized protein YdaU (DUF1376 family)